MRRRRSLSALGSFRRPLLVLIRVKRPASRTVTMGSSATGRASDRRRWTSDIGLTATAPLSRYRDINVSGTGMVSERARDGSPRYWAARGRHRKMWNPAGDILWIVVGDQVPAPPRWPAGSLCRGWNPQQIYSRSVAMTNKARSPSR